MANNNVDLILRIKDNASKGLKGVTAESKELYKSVTALGKNKGVDELRGKFDKLLTTLDKTGAGMQKWGTRLSAGITAPLVAAATGVMMLARNMGALASDLTTLEAQTGLSTDTLQELNYAADVAGTTTENLKASISTLTANLRAGGEQSVKFTRALDAIGIQTRDTNGNLRSMDELFPEIISKLQSVEDGTTRNSLALQIFGGSANDLIPLLGLTAEEFDALRSEAHELGVVLDRDALLAADNFRGEMASLQHELRAVYQNLVLDLIPTARTMVGLFKDHVAPAIKNVAEWVKTALDWFNGLNETGQRTVITIAAFAAALPPLATALGTVLRALALLKTALIWLTAHPVVLALTLITGAAIALYNALGFGGLASKAVDASNSLDTMRGRLNNAETAISGVQSAVAGNNKDSLIRSLENLKKYVDDDLGASIQTLIEQLQTAGTEIADVATLIEQISQASQLRIRADRENLRVIELEYRMANQDMARLDPSVAREQLLNTATVKNWGSIDDAGNVTGFLQAIRYDDAGLMSIDYDYVRENFVIDGATNTAFGDFHNYVLGLIDQTTRSTESLEAEHARAVAARDDYREQADKIVATILNRGDNQGGGGGGVGSTGTDNKPKTLDELRKEREATAAGWVDRLVWEVEQGDKDAQEVFDILETREAELIEEARAAIQAGDVDQWRHLVNLQDTVARGRQDIFNAFLKPEDVPDVEPVETPEDRLYGVLDDRTKDTHEALEKAQAFGWSQEELNEELHRINTDAVERAIRIGAESNQSTLNHPITQMLLDYAIATSPVEGLSELEKIQAEYQRDKDEILLIAEDLGWTQEEINQALTGVAESALRRIARYEVESGESLRDNPFVQSLRDDIESLRPEEIDEALKEYAETITGITNRYQAGLDSLMFQFEMGWITQKEFDDAVRALDKQRLMDAQSSVGADDPFTQGLVNHWEAIYPAEDVSAPGLTAAQQKTLDTRNAISARFQEGLASLNYQLEEGLIKQEEYDAEYKRLLTSTGTQAAVALGTDDPFTQGLTNAIRNLPIEDATTSASVIANQKFTKAMQDIDAQVAAGIMSQDAARSATRKALETYIQDMLSADDVDFATDSGVLVAAATIQAMDDADKAAAELVEKYKRAAEATELINQVNRTAATEGLSQAETQIYNLTEQIEHLTEYEALLIELYGEESEEVDNLRKARAALEGQITRTKEDEAIRKQIEGYKDVSEKIGTVSGALIAVSDAIGGTGNKASEMFSILADGADTVLDVLGNIASGNWIGAIAGAVKGVVSLVQRLINLFTPAWKKVAQELDKEITASMRSALAGAFRDYITGNTDIKEFSKAIERAVHGSILDAIINAIVEAAIIEGLLKELLEKIAKAAQDGDWDAVAEYVYEAGQVGVDAAKEMMPIVNELGRRYKGIFDDAESRKEDTLKGASEFGEFVSAAISIPLYDASYRFSDATDRFVGATNRFSDVVDLLTTQGITVHSTVVMEGESTPVPMY